jgi:hypothetical protein
MLRPREKFRPDVVVQRYFVSEPQPDKYYRHDAALYSLWNHFVEFCYKNNEANGEAVFRTIDISTRNRLTGRLRLMVFLDLSQGRPVPQLADYTTQQRAGMTAYGQEDMRSANRGPMDQHSRDLAAMQGQVNFPPPFYRGLGSAAGLVDHPSSYISREGAGGEELSLERGGYGHEMQLQAQLAPLASSSNMYEGAGGGGGYHLPYELDALSYHRNQQQARKPPASSSGNNGSLYSPSPYSNRY